jgi:hypothetical protein
MRGCGLHDAKECLVNAGIESSRTAWAALPASVRRSARRGAETLDVAVAAVAYGRLLMRRGLGMIVVMIVGIGLFFVVIAAAPALGWPVGPRDVPADVALSIPCLAMVAMFGYMVRSGRLLRRNVAVVAAHPGDDLPDETRWGPARPRLQLALFFGFLAALLIALPLVGGMNRGDWVKEALGVLGTTLAAVGVISAGPSALDLDSGVIGRDGIRLDIYDVSVPWSSIGAIRIVGLRISVAIVGPVTATADPGRWTRSALRRLRPGRSLRITATRPELVMWVSARYTPPPDDAAAEAGRVARSRSGTRSTNR